ncbi:MAG: HlyC/CorC family transporter [Spirochaetales bacterium]|nr:HlyC/CorC family transporter [Spirochaetales bacterium]
MLVLILVVFLTLFISANCSLYEAVLYSTRTGALESARTNPRLRDRALKMLAMRKDISAPIAAILVLNTIANTAGATVAGMYAAQIFPGWGVVAFSIVFTIAILLLAEIMPKTAGAIHWRGLWPWIVHPLRFISSALHPLVSASQRVGSVFGSANTTTITEEEILALVKIGMQEGELSRDESRMVRNIISLEERPVKDIMTPRRVIFALDIETKLNRAHETSKDCGFSRIPLYEGDREHVVGYALREDIEKGRARRRHSLRTLKREIAAVPDTTTCLNLLTYLLKHRGHIAIVHDEFGGLSGLVSLEDLLETILGAEIVDETDKLVDTREAARKNARSNPGRRKKN